MMHAKTHVADGRWSRVGSTNLNVSSLLANWEVDLRPEDENFGAEMECMFEEDLANAREISLVGTARRPRAQTERRISCAERRDQRETPGSGGRAVATGSRVGNAALMASGTPLRTHERTLGMALAAGVLGVSVLGARHPRLLAWPLAVAGGLAGGLGLLRTARQERSERVPDDPNR